MTKYKINEIFESLQGEGAYTGVPSIFVRMQECPVGCPWCDTQHTWGVDPQLQTSSAAVLSKSADSAQWFDASAADLLALFTQKGYTARHVVITGGEPCMYDLNPVSSLLIEQGYGVQIETSGTFEVQTHPDTWVTVSPKINMPGKYPVLASAMHRANEIKHPVAMQKHVQQLDDLLQEVELTHQPLIYLQPISQLKRATELAIQTCIARNWRLSLQTHKYLGIE